MEKTAMQDALDILYKNAEYLSGPDDCSSDRATGQFLKLMAEEIEEKCIPKERQQIEEAYKAGSLTLVDDDSFNDYFTQKFGK